MNELSLTTINTLAYSKIILFVFFGLALYFILTKKKAFYFAILLTAATFIFYLIMSRSLQTLFWGNNGDEVFVFSFLNSVMHFNMFSDFYYHWLPPFYPPLYFWLTGGLAKLVTVSGITAAKIGILGTLVIWFSGTYFWQKMYWSKANKKNNDENIVSSPWFWFLAPLIFFLTLNFDSILFKPYEAISALGVSLFLGLIAESLAWEKWSYKNYIFLGISGGLLFLTYYFWWLVLIPALIFFCLFSGRPWVCLKRVLAVGLLIFLISSIYLIPLFISFIKYGTENWQAVYFVPQYFFSFNPWTDISIVTIILFIGLAGLIYFRQSKFIKANLILLIFCYLYQFINILIFLAGGKSFQAAKPFLFLGNATLAVGVAYTAIYFWQKFFSQRKRLEILTAVIVLILLLPQMPFGKFIEDPVVLGQLEKDLKEPAAKKLAINLENKIPDASKRIWLSSGIPEINAYLPLEYYIAYNPHYSHQASVYSMRFAYLNKLINADSPEEFMRIIDQGYPKKIDSLLLFSEKDSVDYLLYFWQDNFPNGGKEIILKLKKSLISGDYWEEKYQDKNWVIYIKK